MQGAGRLICPSALLYLQAREVPCHAREDLVMLVLRRISLS